MADPLEQQLSEEIRAYARLNSVENAGLNPDAEAEVYNKSKALGVEPAVARDMKDDLDRQMLGQAFDRMALPPTTQSLLANAEKARLVARSPVEWERLSIQEGAWRALKVGWEQRNVADAAARLSSVAAIGGNLEATKYDLIEARKKLEAMPMSSDLTRTQEADSFLEAAKIAVSNPFDVLIPLGLSSAATMRENLLFSAVAYALSPALGAAVTGVGSAYVDYGSTVAEGLQELGADLTDVDSITAVLSDARNIAALRDKASRRAAVVGAFDAIAGGVASFTLKPITTALARTRAVRTAMSDTATYARAVTAHQASLDRAVSPFQRALENLGAQALVGGTLGGAGEAAGQIAAEGRITSIGDVVLEAMSELASAPVDVVVARAKTLREAKEKANAEQSESDNAVIGQAVGTARQSELAQRAPTVYAEWVKNITADGPLSRVYVLAEDVVAQDQAFREALRASVPDIDARIQEAEELGADVVLEMSELSELAAKNPELANALVNRLRLRPEGLTAEEIQTGATSTPEATQEAAVQQVVQQAVKAGESVADRIVFEESLNRATAQVEEAAQATLGKSETGDSEVSSVVALERSIVANTARRLGMSPEEVMTLRGRRLSFDTSDAENGVAMRTPGGSTARGSYTPSENRVRLSKDADARTFVHEMAHFWLEQYITIAESIVADGRLDTPGKEEHVRLVSAFLAHIGFKGKTVKSQLLAYRKARPKVRAAAHEKFAQGFESYLSTGRAPTPELATIFERFIDFIKESWRRLGMRREALSDDVIALYDLLFASEQIAAVAQEDTKAVPNEANAIRAEAAKENGQAFFDADEAERKHVEAEVRARMARNEELVSSAEARARQGLSDVYKAELAKAEAEIRDSEAFRAYRALTTGIDGEKIVINLDAAKAELAPELQRYASSHRWTKKDAGISPSDAAVLLGYDSAEEFVLQARAAREMDVKAAAREIANRRLITEHGDVATPEALLRIATNFCFDDPRLMILHAELRALNKAVGPYNVAVAEAQVKATDALAKQRSNLVTEKKYQAAALRYSRKALNEFGKGNLEAAARAKRMEFLQTVLAKMAWKHVRERNALLRKLKAIHKTKAVSNAVREQLINIAGTIGAPTRARPVPSAPSLSAFLATLPADIQSVMPIPRAIANPPKDGILRAPVEDVEEVVQFCERLYQYGRKEKLGETTAEKADVANAVQQIEATAEQNAKRKGRKPKPYKPQATTTWGRVCDAVGAFFAAHLKASAVARILDGDKIGLVHKLLIQPANVLADAEESEIRSLTEKLHGLLSPFLTRSDPHKDVVTVGGVKYNRIHRLVIALNAGNEGNLARLQNGQGLTMEQINAVLATLTDDDLKIVQAIWDLFESFRPRIANLEREMYGTEPKWVERKPITITRKNGTTVTLAGGYYPIVYDSTATTADAVRLRNADDAALDQGVTGMTTARTFTMERSRDGLDIPLDLTLTGLTNGLQDIVHDLTWRKWLRRTSKIVSGISPTVGKYYGADVQKVLTDWLRNIARGSRQPKSGVFDNFAMALRNGVSIAGLGYNVVSALVSITGLIPAMTRLGVGGTLGALSDYVLHPGEVTKDIVKRSPFMQERTKTMFRELHELNSMAEVGSSKLGKAYHGVQEGAYAMMTFVQGHVDRIVWSGAYRQAIKEGRDVNDAAAYADQVVRDTQGSGLVSDMSAVELGTVGKLFGSFYSFMNTAYNLQAATFLGEADKTKMVTKMLTVGVMLPIVEGFLRASMEVGDDDDDKEMLDYLKFSAGQVVNFNFGLMLGVREMASVAGQLVSGEPVFTWRGPSSMRVLSDLSQAASQAAQAEFDLPLVKAINNLAGSMLGLPAAQINRTLTGIDAWIEEDTDNPLALVLGYKRD